VNYRDVMQLLQRSWIRRIGLDLMAAFAVGAGLLDLWWHHIGVVRAGEPASAIARAAAFVECVLLITLTMFYVLMLLGAGPPR
jgi:hypothetical protein